MSTNRKTNPSIVAALAVLLCLSLGAGMVRATDGCSSCPEGCPDQLSGAIFTTVSDGTVVNGSIYSNKCDVYINGGPPPPHSCDNANHLPDGCYYFQVTDPNGSMLLSTDNISEREFVITGGLITEYCGASGTCIHETGTGRCGSVTIQLMPFDDTPNNGGEYKVWVTPVGCYDPENSACTFGFCSGTSKTDSFKVRAGVTACNELMISCPLPVTLMTEDCQTTCVRPSPLIEPPIVCAASTCTPVNVDCEPPLDGNFCLGTANVTCTATDQCGNSASCSFTVTVMLPDNCCVPTCFAQCPPNTTVACGDPTDPQHTGSATCGDGTCGTADYADSSSSGCGANGTIIRTWRCIDPVCGTNHCEQIITVTNLAPPTITCPPATAAQCEADVVCPGSLAAFIAARGSASASCGGALDYQCSREVQGSDCNGMVILTHTVTDEFGCSASCQQTNTVQDTTPPVLSGCPTDNSTVQCYSDVPPAPTVTATDNCDGDLGTITPVVNETNPGSSCSNVVSRSWTATDGCGNSTNCTQSITVNDTTPPQISCPSDTNLVCGADTSTNSTGAATSTGDNCGGPVTITYADTVASVNSACPNTITRTWIAVDSCNNTNTCTQTINIGQPTGCRVSGGGSVTNTSPATRWADFGGQVGAPFGGTTQFTPNSACIDGTWQHVRHIKGKGTTCDPTSGNLCGSFSTRSFDSLGCACLGCPNDPGSGVIVGAVCNPGDRICGPYPPNAPANKICFSGLGNYATNRGKKTPRTCVFRVDAEDHGEPGSDSDPNPPPDRYRIRIWILTSGDNTNSLRQAVACSNASLPTGSITARPPDIDDGGDLVNGNLQIHQQIGTCP